MYGSGQPAQQVCRQGNSHPVFTLLPFGIKLICCPLASPLLGSSYLQVALISKIFRLARGDLSGVPTWMNGSLILFIFLILRETLFECE